MISCLIIVDIYVTRDPHDCHISDESMLALNYVKQQVGPAFASFQF